MAQGPIDYTSGFGAANPLGGALEAMQAGARFGVLDQQRAGLQQQQMMREQQMLAAQAEQERQGQMAAAVDALIQNPNATRADFDRLAVLMPKDQREGLIGAFNARSTEQQGNDLRFAGQIESALVSGNPAIAQQLITEQAAAERNSGREDRARAYETWAKIAETSPDALRVVVGNILATLPGGGAVLDSIGKVRGEARAAEAFGPEQRKRMADAESAAVAARFAESRAISDLQLTAAQIAGLALDADIKKQNVAIAALNARLGSEGNDLKRRELELKVAEMQDKRDGTARERVGELNAARGNIDNFLNTASRALNTNAFVVGRAAGPTSARTPTLFQPVADFEALIETLGAQSFLSQIPNIKGMGQLSNAEGEKLQSALQNLSLKQSPERLMENIREAQRLMIKARGNIEARYGASPSVPDTPAARTAAPVAPGAPARSVDDLVRQYTR
jgi:hypothetical protein